MIWGLHCLRAPPSVMPIQLLDEAIEGLLEDARLHELLELESIALDTCTTPRFANLTMLLQEGWVFG